MNLVRNWTHFKSPNYFYMNLVRNWTQFKKINTLTFGNNTFLLAQIFDILKIWQNLLIAFYTLKVFMSSVLTFKFMTTESVVIPWAFSCDTKKFTFNVNLWQVIGLKIQSFCKIKPCEAVFVGKNFNWAQTETSSSSSTVAVVQGYFENRNISVDLWQLFRQFIVENLFSSKSVLFSQVDPTLTTKISN